MERPVDELAAGHDEVRLDTPPETMWGMKYPFTRRDGGAEGLLVLVLAFPACLALLSALPVSLSTFLVIAVSGTFSMCAGLLIARWVRRRAGRRRFAANARETEIRLESRDAENRKKLEEARASGAFDRWERR